MLLVSLVCTGIHGALQERTYSTYGPYWRESIFYTVRPHLTNSDIYIKYSRSKEKKSKGSCPHGFLLIFFLGFAS
jgi:hypothetical protein